MSSPLSKSRFMAGIQCHKRLYFETYRRELAAPVDESDGAPLAVGHAVGQLARKRYSGGTLIDEDLDWPDAERETSAAISDQAIPAIFEGAFAFDNIRIRTDILTRTDDGRFDLFEVKSTLDVKPEHQWDLAIQYYVLSGADVPIRWARLLHLNRDYVFRGGEYDLRRLFKYKNLTREVRNQRTDIVAALKQKNTVLASKSPPEITVGPQCSSPYPCPFYDHCNLPECDRARAGEPPPGSS